MAKSSRREASNGVLKSDSNNIITDLNATLLDAFEDSSPQKRRREKPYEFLNSFSKFEEAFDEVQRSNMSKMCHSEKEVEDTIAHYKAKDGILYNLNIENDYAKPGTALLMNFGYSKKGFGLDMTFRRLENMSFYSEREPERFTETLSTSLNYNDKLMNFALGMNDANRA